MKANSQPKRPLLVTAALVLNADASRVLVAQRKSSARFEANKWEFPGGKVEFGETPQLALAREILEELGLEIEVGELFDVVSHVYGSSDQGDPGPEAYGDALHVILLCFLCRLKKGTAQQPLRLDVQDVKWASVADLGSLQFAAADLPPMQKIKSYLKRFSKPLD